MSTDHRAEAARLARVAEREYSTDRAQMLASLAQTHAILAGPAPITLRSPVAEVLATFEPEPAAESAAAVETIASVLGNYDAADRNDRNDPDTQRRLAEILWDYVAAVPDGPDRAARTQRAIETALTTCNVSQASVTRTELAEEILAALEEPAARTVAEIADEYNAEAFAHLDTVDRITRVLAELDMTDGHVHQVATGIARVLRAAHYDHEDLVASVVDALRACGIRFNAAGTTLDRAANLILSALVDTEEAAAPAIEEPAEAPATDRETVIRAAIHEVISEIGIFAPHLHDPSTQAEMVEFLARHIDEKLYEHSTPMAVYLTDMTGRCETIVRVLAECGIYADGRFAENGRMRIAVAIAGRMVTLLSSDPARRIPAIREAIAEIYQGPADLALIAANIDTALAKAAAS